MQPLVRPAGLLFSGSAESDFSKQPVVLTNLSTRPVSYASAHIPAGATWFSISPAQGAIAAGQSEILVVQGKAAGLRAGVSAGAIALQFDDGSFTNIDVTFIKPAPPAPPPSNATCSATRLTGVFTTPWSGTLLAAGDPVTFGARILNECGAAPSAGTARIEFSTGGSALTLNQLPDGVWEGSWTPSDGDIGNVLLTLLAGGAGGDVAALRTARVQVLARGGDAMPVVLPGGVGSAADLVPRHPVAAGGLIAIYGSGFAAQPTLATTGELPNTLAGMQVFLGDRAIPLLFAGARQIDAIVPYDMALNSALPLYVSAGRVRSAEELVVVAKAQPAVFIQPQIGPRQGAIVGPSGLVTASAPARARDRIVIYCEGLGAVSPDLPAGTAAPLNQLFATVNPVTVSIGGVDAVVEFAGLAPGSTGEYQINVVVPGGVPAGDAVPVVVQAAGYQSAAVTIAVR